ncbi:MAG: ABC transporter permease [Gemmatimonadales bacterium]
MSIQPLRHAWRSLRRTPVFTIADTLTLVIGIAASVMIFVLVNGVLLRPLPYGNPDRLVGAWFDLPPLNMTHAQQTQTTYYTFQRLAHTIDGIGLYQDGTADISEPGGKSEPQHLTVAWMTATLLPVLEVSPIRGRNFTAEEDTPNGGRNSARPGDDGPTVVIIGEGLWRTRFGADPNIVGRTVDLNGRTRTIVGVMPTRFRFPSAATQVWLPLGLDPDNKFPGGFNYNAVARLKPGVTLAAAQRDFDAVLPRMVELYPSFAPGVTTQMLMDQAKPKPMLVAMRDDVTGGIAKTLWMIAAAAGLVLLVACANVSNLILVRADGRQRELAVREALGAGRARILSHFFAESVVLSGIAAVIGTGLAAVAIRLLVNAGPAGIPRLAEVGVDGTAILFATVLAALIAVFCSAIPALRIGRLHLSNALREGGRSGTAGRVQHRVRGALVAAQIALALVVLAGSGLLVRTFQRLHAVRPGFDPQNVVTFWMSPPRARYPGDSAIARFYAQLETRIAAVPGVKVAALSSRLPLSLNGMNQNPLFPEDDPEYATKIPPLQINTVVNGEYFRAIGIPIVAGRTFDRLDSQRDGEAIVSLRSAVQFWKDSTGRAALGRRFRELPKGPLYTVIGVAGDARDTALAAPPTQTVYFPEVAEPDTLLSLTARTMAIVVRTAGEPAAIVGAVQAAVHELDPAVPLFDVKAMTTVFDASTAQLSFIIVILGGAAIVTLVLGAIGLYGVMAYVVTLRTKELGVRIALGAQPSAVAAMMTRQGLTITALGVLGGLGLFALVARFLRSFLYGVAPGDPVTLAAASLMLVSIAALASWIPARRAARVDPAEALRAD